MQVAGSRAVAGALRTRGRVNALDRALRAALEKTHPGLADLDLVDYKVRILEGTPAGGVVGDRHHMDTGHGTDAVTRVLVETSDGATEWTTVGVHENVVEASWQALEDAVTYGLLRQGERPDQ